MRGIKTFLSSAVASASLYCGYQLMLGAYSSPSDIVEVKVPSKKFYYKEIESGYYRSEI